MRPIMRAPALAVLAAVLAAAPLQSAVFTPGQFGVSETGAAVYTIPIQVPPGTAGMSPKLALVYNSQAGNGLLGMGWSLSGLSAITRCPRTLAQDGARGGVNYDANDRFCLDGQRLVVITGPYGADGAEYRTEQESFAKIVSYGTAGSGPAWFKVWTKSGQVMEYGNTADSQILAQGKTSARAWALDKVTDTKGNFFTVTYVDDATNGQYYPLRVDYTGNPSSNPVLIPYYSVQFVYESRPDIIPLYQAGALIRTTVRLTNLKTYAGAMVVLDYRVTYTQDATSQRSRIATIDQCTGDGSACLQPTTFGWQNGEVNIPTWTWNSPSIGWQNGYEHYLADVNGDGKPDLMQVARGSNNGYVGLANGDGSFQIWAWSSNQIGSVNGYEHYFADVDGDGNADWIQVARGSNNGYVGISNGDGSFPTWTWSSNQIGSVNGYQHYFADVNGDGKADWIQIARGSNNGYVGLSNGDGSFPTWTWSNNQIGSVNGYEHYFADVDGDGKADWIQVARGSNNGYVGLSNGDGSFPTWTWSSNQIGSVNGYAHYFADVNGDGKADWIQVARGSNNGYVGLSNGDGSFPTWTWSSNQIGSVNGWGHYFADVNGDGKADWIQVARGSNNGYVGLSNGDGSFPTWTWSSNQIGSVTGYEHYFADVNGDGKADWIQVARGSNNGYVGLSTGQVPDLLISVDHGAGGTTSIVYKALSQNGAPYTKDSGSNAASYPNVDLQMPLYVVSSVAQSNGVGGTVSTSHMYGGAKANYEGRGYLGFRWVDATDPAGITTHSEFSQSYPYIGLPKRVTKTSPTGTLVNQADTAYSFNDLAGSNPACGTLGNPDPLPSGSMVGKRYFVGVCRSVEQSWELNGVALPSVTTTNSFDTFGNATQIQVQSSDGYSKTTTNQYDNDSTQWLLGRLRRATVTSTSP